MYCVHMQMKFFCNVLTKEPFFAKGESFPKLVEKGSSLSLTGEKGLYQHKAAEGAVVQEIKQQK